jgi:hypothetical protein
MNTSLVSKGAIGLGRIRLEVYHIDGFDAPAR